MLLLYDVRYAPELQYNLLSVILLLGLGYSFDLDGDRVDIYLDGIVIGHEFLSNNLFKLDMIDSIFSLTFVIDADIDSIIWHAQLGHIVQDKMTRLARKSLLGLLAKVDRKSTRLNSSHSGESRMPSSA